jgi:serine/threonine protein kinase/beta-lactam-binding protein with PASTA domain
VHTAIADPLVGRLLEGRYLIQSQLARGGMSTVYTATDQRLDRLVAVKVMSPALSADPSFTDRFTREARSAAKLTHINAVAVYDQGEESGKNGHLVFLVMELVSGRTLRELLRERGRLTPAEALAVIEPVLAALTAAHRAGLVHRDIKPENILLSEDGVVKVADFGLARAVESDGSSTATGIMMGTVAYCSPEQISRGRTDQRSDVYSAGIVLYELLTGTPPYTGESAVNVAFQHVHNRVPAPSARVRGIDPRLDELVLRATDSDPAGRPMDAGAFLAEMADVRADLDLPVVPVPRPSRDPKAVGRESKAKPNGRSRADEHPTDQLSGDGANHGPAHTGLRHTVALNGRARYDLDEDEEQPPPPVVIPPPKPRKQRTVRSRRRRRALIVLIVLLILGGSVGYGGWWLASGRFSRVPQVGGQNQAQATDMIKHAGFAVAGSVQQEFSDSVAKDAIIATDPAAGARTPRGHRVTLIVSKGKDRVTIPSVAVGSSPAEARSLLGTVPVQVAAVQTNTASDTVPAGMVLGTDPPGGTSVKRDSPVQLIVSSGPPILVVPDETNKTQDAANTELKGLGFVVAVKQDYSPVVKAGLVISQTPGAGESLAKFKTVSLVVSKGPAPVTLPAIASLTPLADAQAQLQGLGLNVSVIKEFGGISGKVVGMDPAAGTVVAFGSTVKLYIV